MGRSTSQETAMKSGYGDIVALLEWATKHHQTSKPNRSERRRKKEHPSEMDIFAILEKKKREAKILEEWLHEQEKLRRKEEKKEEKKHWWLSTPQLAFILVASFPITAPMYVAWIRSILH